MRRYIILFVGIILLGLASAVVFLAANDTPYYNSRAVNSGESAFATLEGKVAELGFADGSYRVTFNFGYGFKGTNFLGKLPASIQGGTASFVKSAGYSQLVTDSASLTLTLDTSSDEGKIFSPDWIIATPLSQSCAKLDGKYDLKLTSSSSIRVVLHQVCKESTVVTYWDIYGLPSS